MFPLLLAYSFNDNGASPATSSDWTSSLPTIFEHNASSSSTTLRSVQPTLGEVLQFEYEADARAINTSISNSDWGPKRDPLYVVIPITVLYAFIFFAGVVGNIGTCIVIARNKCMHTATNYYLFSLAVSDLLLLISGLPPEIYSTWSKYPYIFGEAFCVLQGFAAETSANATVLTITAFTIERYVAICHPFLSHTLSKLSRAIKFIIGIWLLAMFLAIPQAISFGIIYEVSPDGRILNEEHYLCNVKRVIIPHAFEISTLLFFVAPMSMITILYILIGLQLHKSTTVGPSRSNSVKLKVKVCRQSVAFANNATQAILIINGTGESEMEKQEEEGRRNYSRNAQATKHVVKMLVAVVVAFFICWAPFHAQRLLAIYGQPTTANMITAFRILTYLSGILYFLSTTINPLLYHIMSHRFREAFKDTFKRFFRRGRRSTARCYTTLSGQASQANSQSNTDSCSRQSSLRYLDTEVARLQNARRPLVVSFRRKMNPPPRRTKQVVFDLDLQEALDNLERQHDQRQRREVPRYHREDDDETGGFFWTGDIRNSRYYSCENRSKMSRLNDCNFIALSDLEQKHSCPLNLNFNVGAAAINARGSVVKQTDANLLRIHADGRNRRTVEISEKNKVNRGNTDIIYERSFLTKSSTMPPVLFHDGNDRLYAEKDYQDATNGCEMPSEGIWCCNKEYERSSSCSRLELITLETCGGDGNVATTCCDHRHHSGSLVIKVP
ncbi:hypothetical protein Trydic_g5244 [Trypoxylus dichotomus]